MTRAGMENNTVDSRMQDSAAPGKGSLANERDIVIQAGEGYYQALHRSCPELSARELCKVAAQMRKENGDKTVLKVGDHLHLPGLSLEDKSAEKGKKTHIPNSSEIEKPADRQAAKVESKTQAVQKDPWSARNDAIGQLLDAEAKNIVNKIDKNLVKPATGAWEGSKKAVNETIDQTGKLIQKTGKDVCEAGGKILDNTIGLDKNTLDAFEQLKKQHEAYEKQKAAERTTSTISLATGWLSFCHNVDRSIKGCKQMVSSVSDFVRKSIPLI